MSDVRAQYHFRRTKTGVDAWDVRRLITLTQDLPTRAVTPSAIAELDENHWYFGAETNPSPRSIMDHYRLIQQCDISYPIILDESGRVMDGMHRICRAILDSVETIPAVQFESDPAPDYINCDPATLPYPDQ